MKISILLFGKRCSRTSSGRHASTEKDRALCFFSPGPQRTNLSLQTGLRSNGGSVPEKSRFSDRATKPVETLKYADSYYILVFCISVLKYVNCNHQSTLRQNKIFILHIRTVKYLGRILFRYLQLCFQLCV